MTSSSRAKLPTTGLNNPADLPLASVAPAAVPRGSRLLAWLPTLLWLCVLAWFSTDQFSADHTGVILRKIIRAVYGTISHHRFEQIHFLVRKSAHFGGYGLLSLFAFYSWRGTLRALARWTWRWCALALTTALLAASLDEFHQTFVSSRTGSWHDVVLDLTGAVFFQALIALFTTHRSKK